MNTFCHGFRGVAFTRSYYVTLHSFKVTQLQILSNQIKYEQIPLYDFRGVAFTKCHRQQRSLLCPSVGGASEDKNIPATDNIEWWSIISDFPVTF
jgi:hypothetical protein